MLINPNTWPFQNFFCLRDSKIFASILGVFCINTQVLHENSAEGPLEDCILEGPRCTWAFPTWISCPFSWLPAIAGDGRSFRMWQLSWREDLCRDLFLRSIFQSEFSFNLVLNQVYLTGKQWH